METLLKELAEFKEVLAANANADFDENNPNEEFATLAQQLQELIDKHTPSPMDKVYDSLLELVADDRSCEEMIAALVEQSEIDGDVSADNVIDMWEKVEWCYTVDSLLEEIGYFYIHPKK